jgi:hypothetical protein
MDIIIENLQYISFPMPCSHSNLADCSVSDDLSMFNVVIATVRESALRRTKTRASTTGRKNPGEDPVAELLGLSNRTLPLTKETLHRSALPPPPSPSIALIRASTVWWKSSLVLC